LRGIGDIDVMVVGQVPQLDLFEVASRLQKDLGRVVQFNVYEPTSGATYARKRQLVRFGSSVSSQPQQTPTNRLAFCFVPAAA
jgi:hypothetical protein